MPFVTLPSDTGNFGKLIDVGALVTTDGSVNREIVQIGGTAAGTIAPVTSSAGLRVDLGGTTISIGSAIQVQGSSGSIAQVSSGGSLAVGIVSSSGASAAIITVPNGSYTGPFLQVTQGGVNADATNPGSPFYGMQQFGIYSTSLANLTAGQVGAIALTSARGLTVNIVTSSGGPASLVASTGVNIIGSTGQQAVVTSSGAVSVTLASGASGGTAVVDSTAFTQATGSFTPVGGYYTTGIESASSQVGVFAMTSGRGLTTNLVTSSGLSPIVLSSVGSSLAWVQVSNQTVQQVYGTVTTGTALGAQSNPLYMGGQASTAKLADAASGSAQGIWVSTGGAQYVALTNQTGGLIPATSSQGLLSQTLESTAAGYSVFMTITSSAGNLSTTITAVQTLLKGYSVFNMNAAARFLKIFNTTSAPTLGTATPVMTIVIPGSTLGAGANVSLGRGVGFSAGLSIAFTDAIASTSTGSISAGDVAANLYYV